VLTHHNASAGRYEINGTFYHLPTVVDRWEFSFTSLEDETFFSSKPSTLTIAEHCGGLFRGGFFGVIYSTASQISSVQIRSQLTNVNNYNSRAVTRRVGNRVMQRVFFQHPMTL